MSGDNNTSMMHQDSPPAYEMYNNQVNQVLVEECEDSENGDCPTPVDEIPDTPTRRTRFKVKGTESLLICLRELFGTAVYTYIGCLSMEPFSQGFTYSILQASADVSSCGGLHLNPVLTMAAAISGKMKSLVLIIPMIICQFIGCLLGAGLCRGSQTKDNFLKHREMHYFGSYHEISEVDTDDIWHYFLAETVLTCILTTVFLHLLPCAAALIPANEKEAERLEKRKYIHALFVGLAILTLSYAGLRIRCGLMNPFRAFGSMVVYVTEQTIETKGLSDYDYDYVSDPVSNGNLWKGHWIYWAGPVVGAIIASGSPKLCYGECMRAGNS